MTLSIYPKHRCLIACFDCSSWRIMRRHSRYSRLLVRSGHKVTASSMRSDLAAAAQGRFDAVISDLGLPDGTGFELMQSLCHDYGVSGIALSGYGMDDDLRRSP